MYIPYLPSYTYTHTQYTSTHPHTHAPAHTSTHAHTQARTHTHTHVQFEITNKCVNTITWEWHDKVACNVIMPVAKSRLIIVSLSEH